MFVRLVCLPVLALALAGCLVVTPPVGNDESELTQLRAENKGLILIHTSLADGSCFEVVAKITQPDASGRYVDGYEVYLRRPPIKGANGPSEIVLPSGDYGIVALECHNLTTKREMRSYNARVATRGNAISGEGTVYEQPIAKFSVQPGEFVDIGSINVLSVRTPDVVGQNGGFTATVTPIEGHWVQPLAAVKPRIYGFRVQRLMTVPGQAQQPGPIASPRAAR